MIDFFVRLFVKEQKKVIMNIAVANFDIEKERFYKFYILLSLRSQLYLGNDSGRDI